MAADEVTVATVALTISIVALMIAFGQLVQQLFGTADGYRRCQSSVIGDWSQLVQLRFRWSSFRLEVRVATPHFEICLLDKMRPRTRRVGSSMVISKPQRVAITGSDASRLSTRSRTRKLPSTVTEDEEDEDIVSWSSLLAALHDRQQLQFMHPLQSRDIPQIDVSAFDTMDQKYALVCIKPKTRSWDLMPPDIVRPVASTTLGTLISIVHRMGMIWLDLIPRDGKLRAEGLEQSLSATMIRGMGIVVEYNVERGPSPLPFSHLYRSLYVPSIDADKMACGIIPGSKAFATWDIHLRTYKDDPDTNLIIAALEDMNVKDSAIEAIQQSTLHKNTGHYWPAFVDILGLWSDWVPLSGSLINRVLSPMGHRVYTMGEVYEARVVWRWFLQEQESQGTISPIRRRVLRLYESWEKAEPQRFYKYYKVEADVKDRDTGSLFKKTYDETTAYFEDACIRYSSDFYVNLVTAHINANAHSLGQADENVKAGTSRNDGRVGHNLWDTLFTERAFIYVDNIPKVCKIVGRFRYEQQVEDAWWMLMLRGQCWEMGINRIVQKSCVPSSYYNSPTRVYIS